MIDYHIHTRFSPDSKTTIEELLIEVKRKGIYNFCVTDHFEYTYVGDWLLENQFSPFVYANHLRDLGLIAGIELGWNGMVPIVDDFRNFDFVILSIHEWFVPLSEGQRSYQAYLQRVWSCIHHFDHFHVLGHLDFPRRYEPSFQPFGKELYGLVRDIFQRLIQTGKGVELNTKVYGNGNSEYGLPHPDIQMLALYREMGGTVITIGSDAHGLDAVGRHIQKGLRLLQDLGFRYLSTFNLPHRRWEMEPISRYIC